MVLECLYISKLEVELLMLILMKILHEGPTFSLSDEMALGCMLEASFTHGLGIYAFLMHFFKEHSYHNPSKVQLYSKKGLEWIPEETRRIPNNILQAEFYYCPPCAEEDGTTTGHPFAEIVLYPVYWEPKDPEGNKPKWRMDSMIIILCPLERFYSMMFSKIYTTQNGNIQK